MSTCIPYADGIWHMGGPPNWGLANLVTPVIDTIDATQPAVGAIKDPRWRGAVNQSFGAGIAEDASFRAVWYETAGKRYLYFSWHVKFDSDPDSTIDRLYVVIAPSASGGTRPLVVDIQPFTDTADHLTAEPPDAIVAGRRRIVAGPNPGEGIGTNEVLGNLPDWLNETRVWRSGTAAAQGQWAIHMRVPIDPAATDVDGDNGLRLTTSFNMWYEFRIAEAARADASGTGITGGVLRLNIPAGVSLTGGGTVFPNPNTAGQGENYTYGVVAGINGISCPAVNGISIQYLDIGTTNVPDSFIHPTNSNTFVARPRNNSGALVAASAINATFRLADWGSSRTDAAWTTIQSGVTNSGSIDSMTQANATNDIRFSRAGMAAAFPNVAAEPHQCMLVELSGAGLLFTTSSVVRNMDFVLNSKDVRPATISVKGLPPISSAPRDVYLAVEKINMPAQTQRDLGQFGPVMVADVRPSHDDDQESLFNKVQAARTLVKRGFNPDKHAKPAQRLALMLDALREVRATPDDLDQLFPTYRVHVYYDTGETWTVDGATYPLLGLHPSFGFYAYHEGPLLGFNTQLRGAIRLAENFYLLRVPNNGSAKITTILHGISPGEENQMEPEEPIQAWPKPGEGNIGCLARLLAMVGMKL